MGEATIFFKDFRSDHKTQYWTLALEPRKSKPKEKITGPLREPTASSVLRVLICSRSRI